MAVTKHSDAVAPVRSSGPVTIWFSRHVKTAGESFGRLLRQPFASLMIILVIAVTLAIPAALNLAIKNFAAISNSWDEALDFSVFLDTKLSVSDAEGIASLIAQRADVADVTLITADEALEEFKQQSGFGDALNQLADNPLPHALVVRPSPANTAESMILLREELASLPEIDNCRAPNPARRRSSDLVRNVRRCDNCRAARSTAARHRPTARHGRRRRGGSVRV